MPSENLLVHVIDDDEASRQSLAFLLQTADIEVRTYASATVFLDLAPKLGWSCVITDLRMPGMSGIDLLRRLKELDVEVPVIVITGHGDVLLAVEAMKIGAVDFLEKPFDDKVLLASVRGALARRDGDKRRHGERAEIEVAAGDAVASGTRRAFRAGFRTGQQADRLRSRHQSAHGRDLPG